MERSSRGRQWPLVGTLVLAACLGGCMRLGFTARSGGVGDAAVDMRSLDNGTDGARDGGLTRGNHLPVVTEFAAVNSGSGANAGTTTFAAGDPLTVSFTVHDDEGLASGPVDLALTVDGGATWTAVVTGYGTVTAPATEYRGTYSQLKAPSAGVFRLRIVAWDIDGNSSLPVLSDLLNGGSWSVYAGSDDRGVGGSGPALALRYGYENTSATFAVCPISGDIFALDGDHAVVRWAAQTGRTSVFARVGGVMNLPDDGPLPSEPAIGELASMSCDNRDRLYLKMGTYETKQYVLYQIDVVRRWSRRHLGWGKVIDSSATAATVALADGPEAFDEDSSLYFFVSCTPGIWNQQSTLQLMKVTQTADGRPQTFSVVAGNCVKGDPPSPGPTDATKAPITSSEWAGTNGSLAVWNRGEVIYFGVFGTPIRKVLKGKLYDTDLASASASFVAYSPRDAKLYVGDRTVIRAYAPRLDGPRGEQGAVWAGAMQPTPGCAEDGVPASQACLSPSLDIRMAPSGALLFVDGATTNSNGAYRVRTVDAAGNVQTLLGSTGFVGDGLDRRVVRAAPAGIAFKPASAPNQSAFPAGLYVMDRAGPTLLHIPASGAVRVVWGNQTQNELYYPTGTAVSKHLGLGSTYRDGNAMALALDSQGLPWLRYNGVLARVDSAGRIVALQGEAFTGQKNWDRAPAGANPRQYDLWPYGTLTNLAVAGDGVFLIGGFMDNLPAAVLRYFDFAQNTVSHLMGTTKSGISADTSVAGELTQRSLASACYNWSRCYLDYRADEDRLYFSEVSAVRFITKPTTPAQATLGTLFEDASFGDIYNFAFRPDGKQLHFITSDGKLRCHDLGSGAASCDHRDLGPPAPLPALWARPNQLAFEDNAHLFISSGRGEVYRFTTVQ